MYQNGAGNGFYPNYGTNYGANQYPQNQVQSFAGGNQYQHPSYYQQVPLMKTNRVVQGRIVGSIDEVTPNDVPMDGNMYPFIAQDYSCVYGKRWNSNGQIETTVFIPKPREELKEEKTVKLTEETYQGMVNAFQAVATRLERIEKLLAPLAEDSSPT